MRAKEFIFESMDLTAVKFSGEHDAWSNVMPAEWQSYYNWDNHPHTSQDELPTNPDYKPEYNMNLSNRNMRWFMDELGLQGDNEGFHIEIDEFLGRASSWLQKNMNKPSAEVPTVTDTGEEPAPKSNVDTTFLTKKYTKNLLNDPAFIKKAEQDFETSGGKIEIPDIGSSITVSNVDQYMKNLAYVEAIAKVKAEHPPQPTTVKTGPTMVDFGVSENYFNENMARAMKIAQKGKELGATHIAAY